MLIEEVIENKPNIANLVKGMPLGIRKRCLVKNFPPKTVLLKKDDDVKWVYIFCNGTVIVKNEFENGQLYNFTEVDSVDFIGEVEVLAGETQIACTVETTTNCTLLQLTKEDFMKWIECDHNLSIGIAKSVAKKMYPTSYHNGDIMFYSGIYKVVSFIIKYSDKISYVESRKCIKTSRQEIGDKIGISIRTVNRSIKKLKDKGLISVRHGNIFITEDQYFNLVQYLEDLK